MGQLLTETKNGDVINSMTYDGYGNILTKNGNTYGYIDAAWDDLLTHYNGQRITYDAQGNPTAYRGKSLVWEKGRQLKSYDGISYTYNANGIRTSKTIGNVKHTYILDGTKILKETWGENTLVPLYDNEDSVCGISYNGTSYYFVKNLQGDIIAIANASNAVIARYSYDAWGKGTVVSDSTDVSIATINPYRYRGYYYDVETGLYYLQSRYYDPEVGRFINGDDQMNCSFLGTNIFSYCINTPVIAIDKNGKRTYFINGINNTSSTGIPEYSDKFSAKLTKLGIMDVRTIGVYKGKLILGLTKVALEMLNFNIYTKEIAKLIKQDLKDCPLKNGEQLNLIGYSGGGQIALNVMEKLKGKITNVILIGTPIAEIWKTTSKIHVIYSGLDPLSWNIGWGWKSYFAGWIGHTSYFSKKNIDKIAKIVDEIID